MASEGIPRRVKRIVENSSVTRSNRSWHGTFTRSKTQLHEVTDPEFTFQYDSDRRVANQRRQSADHNHDTRVLVRIRYELRKFTAKETRRSAVAPIRFELICVTWRKSETDSCDLISILPNLGRPWRSDKSLTPI